MKLCGLVRIISLDLIAV